LQTKLLTVLDEERVRRLGGSLSKKVKTKIICATNRNLRRCVEEGSFRSDLYFRINVLEVNIPPIRERPRDILALVHHFMTQLCRQYGMKKYLCADVQDILLAYSWPGNIREIRNIVERLVVFSSTEQIAVGDLPPAILHSLPASRAKDNDELESAMTLRDAVKQFERRLIEQALAKYGTVADAATVLGIDPTTLGRKLKKP
jgi:transcriptional regulator with PAS, ATPase and Fis domain